MERTRRRLAFFRWWMLLADTANSTDYLKKMRKRDVELGAYLGTNCPQVEMIGQNGLKRKVLAGNTKAVLCLIKSIPSKKAEPSQNLLDSFLYC